MPNGINIPTPPTMTGDTQHQIMQIYNYLFRLAEQLQMILTGLENK